MGYTTDFTGRLKIGHPEKKLMTAAQVAYINNFSKSRRMKRDANKAETLSDPIREAVGLPIGIEGGYYVGSADQNYGQNKDSSVIDSNSPPQGQPGLWCQWVVNPLSAELIWDGGEKFYSYVEWLNYLIEHFFQPWGFVLNGSIDWQGEERKDRGTIIVINNKVATEEKYPVVKVDTEKTLYVTIKVKVKITGEHVEDISEFANNCDYTVTGDENFQVLNTELVHCSENSPE